MVPGAGDDHLTPMMNLLLGSPLLFFLALLPAAGIVAFVSRGRLAAVAPALTYAGLGIALLSVAGIALFAISYLLSPVYSDHIEPNTAIVAWIYANGGPIYHELDAAERYAFLYGPLAYVFTGWLYQVFGAATLTAKLLGFLSLLAAMVLTGAALRVRADGRWWPVIAGLGYFAILALFFKHFSFWSKPDSLMIAMAALGLAACTLQSRNAWILCGLAFGVAVNAKITGGIYLLPCVAYLFERDGLRAPVVTGIIALAVAALPFLDTQNISLVNYVAWLQAAGGHGLNRVMFLQNAFFILFALVPVAALVVLRPALLKRHIWVVIATLLALTLIQIAASKPGSGPHHFLPFLPLLTVPFVMLLEELRESRTAWLGWAVITAMVVPAVIKSGMSLYYGLGVVNSQFSGANLAAEIATVSERYPDRNIYMGYGDGTRYTTTFARDQLAFAGYPYLVDASAIMDFQLSGIEIPAATISSLLADHSAVWLIPAGQEPFTLLSWYFRNTGGMTFDASFRQAFGEYFSKQDSTESYDIYLRK